MNIIITSFLDYMSTPPPKMEKKNYRSFVTFSYGSLLGLSCHIFLLILFILIEVWPLAYFNIASVLCWAFIFYLARKGYITIGMLFALSELTIHHVLCVLLLGWSSGFQYGLFLVPLVAVLGPTGKPLIKSSFIIASIIALFACYFYSFHNSTLYVLTDSMLKITNVYAMISLMCAIIISGYYFNITVEQADAAAECEYNKSEMLLHNILPFPIAVRLKAGESVIADDFEATSVLFADIVDFTPLSQGIVPSELVRGLNRIFSIFDGIAETYGMEKIKTIGDAYMAAAGIPERRADHANAAAEMAMSIMHALEGETIGGKPVRVRVGINSGPAVAGVIGKIKFIYDLWGDCVNTASRMESHGLPGEIQVTAETYELLKDSYLFERRGTIIVKGKGEMETYLLKGKKTAP